MAKLIMATRAPEMPGFPAILNEMLRRSNYLFQPEYEVYARGVGVGLVDYMATLHLEARLVVGAVKYNFRACGTSVEMVIQEVAREAIRVSHCSCGLASGWAVHLGEVHGGHHFLL
jgi:hypothetical protein